MLSELYKQYGELMIQAEITQAKINEIKKLIADELNKANQQPVNGKVEDESITTV